MIFRCNTRTAAFVQCYHSVKATESRASPKALDISHKQEWPETGTASNPTLHSPSAQCNAHPFSITRPVKAAGTRDPQIPSGWRQCVAQAFSWYWGVYTWLLFCSAALSLGRCCCFSIPLASALKTWGSVWMYGLAFTHLIHPPPKYDFSLKRIAFSREKCRAQ